MPNFLSQYIDHTKLGPLVNSSQIHKLVDEALTYKFRGVCIAPCFVEEASTLIKNKEVLIITTISFPFGQDAEQMKIDDAIYCIQKGADEIDMVMNIGRFKNQEYKFVENEIISIKKAIGSKALKVIIETALLTQEEIINATKLIMNTDADFIKTSTGYSSSGASVDDIKLIKKTIGNHELKIKASGGIKNKKACLEFIESGASIIGTSNGVSIILEQANVSEY